MKTLNINSRTVTVNINQLSKGLFEMHEQDQDKATVLKFGLLDEELCTMFTNHLSKKIKAEFSELTNVIFETKINAFINDTSEEVLKGIYTHAKLIV